MKNVLIPPIVDYRFLKQLPQQMAEQFANNGYKVHYCNMYPVNKSVIEVSDNLTVYNDCKVFLNLFKSKKMKIDIFYNTWAKNYNWLPTIKPDITIYHSCDMFEEWTAFEPLIMKQSDVVLATSQMIYDERRKNHDNVHLVRNACNESMINAEWKCPEDIAKIENPIGLFSGAIGNWVKTFLLSEASNHCNTVLVGSEFGKQRPQKMINLGIKKHSDLVNYYNASDIGLLPFNVNSTVTQAANPIKMWEYLACGLPVLATSWVETDLPELKDVVFTANETDKFIEKLNMLLNLNENEKKQISEKAKEIARNNTWEKRFKQVEDIIKNLK